MKNSGKTDWERLKKIDDVKIDYSDISETEPEFWEDAALLYPHKKVVVKLKIDEDIAIWLKPLGDKSDNAVNNLLRSFYIGIKNFPSER